MTKIIQISDTHIVKNNELAYGQLDTRIALENTVKSINHIKDFIGGVDMVIVSGDLTDHGDIEEYYIFQDIMADLNLPYVMVPGNHDHKKNIKQAFKNHPSIDQQGEIHWQLSLANINIIGLDSSVVGAHHGELTKSTLDWLESTLSQLNDLPVMIVMHHPSFDTGIAAMDEIGLKNKNDLFTSMAKFDKKYIVVSGHVHRYMITMQQNFMSVIAPSTAYSVALDYRAKAAEMLIKESGGFLLHEIKNGNFMHQFIPVGDFGELSAFVE